MSSHLLLNKTPRGRCRICAQIFYDTDSDRVIARHNQRCAQEFYEARKPERDRLKFLESQDPELQEWVTSEYRAGRLKPSTERVT